MDPNRQAKRVWYQDPDTRSAAGHWTKAKTDPFQAADPWSRNESKIQLPGEASASSSWPLKKLSPSSQGSKSPRPALKERKEVKYESDQYVEAVLDSSIMDKLMEELAAKRQEHQGFR